MSSEFDWRTDEEEWDEAPTEETIPAGPSPARRWPLIVLIVAIAFGLISYLTIREVDNRTSEALDAAEANLQASLQQVVRADQEQDPELLRNVLSGRDDAWAAAAEFSAGAGSLYQRDSFGWQLTGEPRVITQTGSADLSEYIIQFALDYQVAVRTGALEPLTLKHTARFRQGTDGRWLLTPPDADYWGPTRRSASNVMETTFPEIDAEFGYPFAQEVERLIGRICNQLAEMDCVPDIAITVELSTDPASLTSLVDWQDAIAGRLDFVLPTPSLFGQPTTLLGQTRLRETYLRIIAQGIIGAYTNYDCCEQVVFYDWLLREQLRRLSLGPGHLPRELAGQNGLYQPAPTQLDLNALQAVWTETEPTQSDDIRLLLIPFFSFLTRDGRVSHTALQRSLAPPGQDFWEWLWLLEGGRYTIAGLQRLYADFAHQAEPPNQAETLLLSCIDQRANNVALFQFQPHQIDLVQLATTPTLANAFHLMTSSSGAAYVSRLAAADSELPFNSWRYEAGALTELSPPLADNQLLLDVGGPAEAIGYVVELPADGADPTRYLYYLDSCTATDCPNEPARGVPLWSPDGSWALFAATNLNNLGEERVLAGQLQPLPYQNYPIYLARIHGRIPALIGVGRSPAWVSERRFVYIFDQSGKSTVMDVRMDTAAFTREAITVNTLAGALEPLLAEDGLADINGYELISVHPNQADPTQYFFVVGQRGDAWLQREGRRLHLVSLNRTSMVATHLFSVNGADYDLAIAPAGDFFTLYTSQANFQNNQIRYHTGQIYYHNITSGATTPGARQDEALNTLAQRFGQHTGVVWSPSGDWVVSFVEGLRIWSPRTGAELATPNLPAESLCYDAAWITEPEFANP